MAEAAQAAALFERWDLDGSGFIEFAELQQVLQSSELGDALKTRHGKKLKFRLEQRLFEDGRVRPLGKEDFVQFITNLVDTGEWSNTYALLDKAVTSVRQLTAEDRRKRVQWSLFQLLDINQDGVVEWSELQNLLNSEASGRRRSRGEIKTDVRWRLRLEERAIELAKAEGGTEPVLKLRLADFHKYMEDVFRNHTEDEYVEDITKIQEVLSRSNSESAHREYLESERVPEMVNEMVAFLLERKPPEPLDGIIEFLEKRQEH